MAVRIACCHQSFWLKCGRHFHWGLSGAFVQYLSELMLSFPCTDCVSLHSTRMLSISACMFLCFFEMPLSFRPVQVCDYNDRIFSFRFSFIYFAGEPQEECVRCGKMYILSGDLNKGACGKCLGIVPTRDQLKSTPFRSSGESSDTEEDEEESSNDIPWLMKMKTEYHTQTPNISIVIWLMTIRRIVELLHFSFFSHYITFHTHASHTSSHFPHFFLTFKIDTNIRQKQRQTKYLSLLTYHILFPNILISISIPNDFDRNFYANAHHL